MKYADINRKLTDIVADYMSRGYVINTGTMHGMSGERMKVDLTNGDEIIRVLLSDNIVGGAPFCVSLRRYTIRVGRDRCGIPGNVKEQFASVWNEKLDILEEHKFYELTDGYKEPWYVTGEEAIKVSKLQADRRWARCRRDPLDDVDLLDKYGDDAMRIARALVRKHFAIQRVSNKHIRFRRTDGKYLISYKMGSVWLNAPDQRRG